MIAGAIALLTRLPLKDWLYFAGVVAAAGFVAFAVHHERQLGRAEVEAVRKTEHAQLAATAASQVMADRLETARVAATQKEVIHEADRFNAAAAVAARGAADADHGLRERIAAASGHPAAAAASAADPGAPADSAPAVSWRVFIGVDDAAGQFATYADQLKGALDACVGSYNALTPN